MSNDQRLDLARELTRRLLARHGQQAILAVGLHGAGARAARAGAAGAPGGAIAPDGPDELDLAVVTTGPEVEVPPRTLRHHGTVIDLAAIAAEDYLEEAGQVGPAWPLAADQYLHQVALHDPTDFFHKLRHAHESAVTESPREVFLAAAGYDLVQLAAWEARARADELAGDLPSAMLAVKEGAVLAALVMGLVRRRAYPDPATALRATATAEDAPEGFTDQYRRLLAPTIDPTSAVLALGRVLASLEDLARREGVPFEAADLDEFL